MPDLEISKLPALAGSALQATDPVALADLSASETKKVTVKDLIQSGIALIDNGSIPSDKLNFTLGNAAVGTSQLAAGAVTAEKLASNSTAVVGDVASRHQGAFIGQLHYDTSTGKTTIWDGGTWQPWKAAGSVNTITADTTGVLRVTAAQVGDTVSIDAEPAPTAAGGQFLAGPAIGGGPVSPRSLVSSDLPKASTSALGAVTVPLGHGLRINGGPSGLDASLEIANDIPPSGSDVHLVAYDHKGLVTHGRLLTGSDLPVATSGTPGAVALGNQFALSSGSQLRHVNTVAPATATKVSYDAAGHVTGSQSLTAADIPSLDASKLTTGFINAARIAPASIPKEALANYATTIIQEADPGKGDYVGQFWYKESDAQLRTWSGNSWIGVGFGRLSVENLRFCGIFSAADGHVVSVTALGKAAGLVAGAALPAPSEALSGVYLVASAPGTFNGETYDNGDWTLCLGSAPGTWSRIDTLSSAGGGTTSLRLKDLLDIHIATPNSGDTLVFDSLTNQWVNKPTAAQKAKFVEAFDGVRTSFTMNKDANLSDELLVSLGGVLQEPDADFSFTAPRTVNFITAPPAGLEHWILVEGIASTGGGGGSGGGTGTSLPNGTAANELLRWNMTLGKWRPEAVGLTAMSDVFLNLPSQGDFLQRDGAGKWVNVSTMDEGTWT